MFFSEVIRSPVLWLNNPLKSSQISSWSSKHHRFFLRNLRLFRKSLATFGYVRKCPETIVWTSEIFWRIFGKPFKKKKKNNKQLPVMWNFSSFIALTREISTLTLEEKFHIYAHTCIILHMFSASITSFTLVSRHS